jgi:hemerythrin-like domain-containing protein
MPRSTSRFAAQHAEIDRMAREILQQLEPAAIARDAAPIRRLLAAFGGRIRIHVAMENEALYPRLLGCGDPAVEAKARELYDSFGGVYDALQQVLARWSETAAITASPQQFVDDVRAAIALLQTRIAREDAELYPLVDRLDA